MFGISPSELIVIIIVALLVLGPDKLPGLARTLGRLTAEMRRLSTEFQRTLHTEIEPEARPAAAEASDPAPQAELKAAAPAPAASAEAAAAPAPETASAAPNLDHNQERGRP